MENKKILYTIQYSNNFSLTESQNVNIVTYEAVEIPDVITVNSSSCEYFGTLIQETNETDVAVEENISSDPNLIIPSKNKQSKKPTVKPKDERKPRGRKLKVPNQTRAQRKKNVNTNKLYTNSKGEVVEPRQFDADFHCTCPKKCTDNKNLPLKTRMQVFNMFWGVGTFEGRCAFINSCVNEVPKKRCYTKNKVNQRRKNTRKYYLKGVEVCKVTFIKTLLISSSRVDSSLAKTDSEIFTDKRGKKKSGLAFSNEKKQLVVNHIKDCYNPLLTLRGMWNQYMESYPDDAVSESFYKRMFYENYNLKFNKIKKEKETTFNQTLNQQ